MEIKGMGRSCGPTSLTPSIKTDNNADFREILKARISQTNAASPAIGKEPNPVLLAQSVKVLDLLDGFAQALADPRRTLKDMVPLVRGMEGEVGRLDDASCAEGKQATGDLALARDVSLLAHVALIKFDRGDFV